MYAALYHPFLTDIGHQEYGDNLCGRLSEVLQVVHVVIVGRDVQLGQGKRRMPSNAAVSAIHGLLGAPPSVRELPLPARGGRCQLIHQQHLYLLIVSSSP